MCLSFPKQQTAIIHSSWLDPRKVREITIVGSRRMIVYDDLAPLEKIRVFDARVERPPHYDTFAEFHYAYHYGDMYAPYIKQEEPLKTECQHFLDCIRQGTVPITSGQQGMDLVRILEASSESLKRGGAPVEMTSAQKKNGSRWLRPVSRIPSRLAASKRPVNGFNGNGRAAASPDGRKLKIKVRLNGVPVE